MAGKAQKLVLCAEDNSDDAFFCQQSARALGADFDFRVVPDGPSVIGWLTGQSIYVNPEIFRRPDIVVLDVSLPCMDGFETLRWIRQHKEFDQLPVIIHSSSSSQKDRDLARQLGATEYIVKDLHCTRLVHFLKVILNDNFAAQIGKNS